MSQGIQAIRVMNDYSVRLPVWAFNDEDGLFFPYDLFIDPLRSELHAWANEFDQGFDLENGWSSVEQLERHCATGRDLAAKVRAVLPPSIPVTCDIWELTVAGKEYIEGEDGSFRPLRTGEHARPIKFVLGREPAGPSPWDPPMFD